ncbi:MAG: hypothetical protein KDK51_05175 [Deltaproteobacteria bacterium]|nr:hypothetical protein [Deltaproteobacteria bacterium]
MQHIYLCFLSIVAILPSQELLAQQFSSENEMMYINMAATMLQTKLDTTFSDYSGIWVLTHSMLTDTFPKKMTQNNQQWEERQWMIEDHTDKTASSYTRKIRPTSPPTITIKRTRQDSEPRIDDPFYITLTPYQDLLQGEIEAGQISSSYKASHDQTSIIAKSADIDRLNGPCKITDKAKHVLICQSRTLSGLLLYSVFQRENPAS